MGTHKNNKKSIVNGLVVMSEREAASEIRRKLMRKLGFEVTPPPSAFASSCAAQNGNRKVDYDPHNQYRGTVSRFNRPAGLPASISPPRRSWLIGTNVLPQQEPLHGSCSPTENSRLITFDDSVSVVPIPERNEYSNRVKARIWSDRYELHENVQRNTMEYAYEGWNWRTVIQDEGMFVNKTTGEMIHPVHYQRWQRVNQRSIFSDIPAADNRQQHHHYPNS